MLYTLKPEPPPIGTLVWLESPSPNVPTDAAWYHTTSAQHRNALCFCPGFAAKIKIMERSCTTFSGSSGMLHQPVMAVPFKSEWPFPSSLKWGNSPRQYVRISHTSADTHRMKASSHSMLATNAPHTYRDR